MKPNKVIDQYVSSWASGILFVVFLAVSAFVTELILRRFGIDNFIVLGKL